ncbi:GNAT family N-acetyltransferase [Robertkochia marina]|uniref:GNAT family N-acetyltransferase n=1 Tax=Robertkochia marina TaxID=1227945 RepID=A0A4S3M2F2_9FLAO|nr:GNAT family N-acetyltransferase [Robertkochia marina]THD69302.1 GNAT family N-acetyltransferase [Robertkochia marina]TRZ47439.1 GNAT family N-acetyltransferase [Robertkochia marina]
MEIRVKTFEELSIEELYELLRLRSEVFVVEQDCVYQDIDNKDHKALHVMGFNEDRLAAYTRIFRAGDYFAQPSIGRVVVRASQRGKDLGHKILRASIETVETRFGTTSIEISAQTYLEKFYNDHQFRAVGETYLEDGIPHVKMIRG